MGPPIDSILSNSVHIFEVYIRFCKLIKINIIGIDDHCIFFVFIFDLGSKILIIEVDGFFIQIWVAGMDLKLILCLHSVVGRIGLDVSKFTQVSFHHRYCGDIARVILALFTHIYIPLYVYFVINVLVHLNLIIIECARRYGVVILLVEHVAVFTVHTEFRDFVLHLVSVPAKALEKGFR